MKRLFAIVLLCGFLIPYAYGETLKFSNQTYEGEVVDGRPHGPEVLIVDYGTKYAGEFKDA